MAKKSSSEMPGVMPLFSAGPGRARRARSVKLSDRSGAPLATTWPSRKIKSAASISRLAEARRKSLSLTLRDAPTAALPAITVDRLALLPLP